MKNKVALVTGASRGMGQAIASCFKEVGITVISPSRNEMDLASNQSIDDYMSKLREPIDILVNNAGIQKVGKCTELSAEDFQKVLQVNLIAPFKLITLLVGGMKERSYGRIVNISSIWGSVSREDRSLYSSSKAGLNGLTTSLAIELAPYNILVNAVAPGYVNTDLIKRTNTKEELERRKHTVPLKRFAESSEIAEYVEFLCSERNSYMTGQILTIDGGLSINKSNNMK